MHKISLLFALAIIGLYSCRQSFTLHQGVTVAFYNVENLFDTINDPNKLDDEFLPLSEKNWNTERYKKKLNDLVQVVSSIQEGSFPILLGVCEIENDKVLSDLVASPKLKKANYRVIWNEGPDERGIDCALMYRPDCFKLLSTHFLAVNNPDDSMFATREIVYASGLIGDELFHVFVNHWPSRRAGQDDTKALRALAASTLRGKVDSIFKALPEANILIMGDMNDEPGNESLASVLDALPNDKNPEPQHLVNLMYDEYLKEEGSYNYRGNWDMIDNLIVSGHLITKEKGLASSLDNGYIFHQPFMEFKNDQGQISPNRTYGRNYYGGISDHFPVYLILKKR